MTEHKLVTFEKEDIIKALELYYEQTQGQKIDINFDANNIKSMYVERIVVKIVAYSDRLIRATYAESNVTYPESELSQPLSGGGYTTYNYNAKKVESN